jgi:integrase
METEESGMIRKRGNRWVATVYNQRARKKVWVGTFETKGEAREAEGDALKRLKRRGGRPTETVAEFAARWMDDYPRAKESTGRHYREQIRAFVRDYGSWLLVDVDRREARSWALKNKSWRAARALFSDAKRDGLCDENPFTELRLERSRGRRDLVVPTEAEIDRLCECAGEAHAAYGRRVYRHMIRFAAFQGLRPGELFGLDWRHVDLTASTVLVERQWSGKLGKFTSPKNDRSRTVFLTPQAREALEALPRQAEAIFLTPTGKRFSSTVSHYYWHPVRCAFGRPDLDFYALRHFFGTHLAMLGVGPVEIAQAMGHSDGGKLAMETYIHLTEQDARARIARAFGSASTPLRPVPVAMGEQAGGHGAS